MSESVAVTPPKGQRQRKPNRPRDEDGGQSTTPGRSNTPRQDVPANKHSSGYYSSSGRLQKNKNGGRQQHQHEQTSTTIPSVDGAASPVPASRPIPIQSANENKNPLATPAKQAYAGPTFHASPAPSALPMPKFFSRSLPANDASTMAAEASPSASPSRPMPASPSPATSYAAGLSPSRPPVQREASPLDILFNAHRAEKAREKSGTVSGDYQPQDASPWREPANDRDSAPQLPFPRIDPTPAYHISPNNAQRPSSKEMFLMEVDSSETQQHQEPQHTLSFEQRLRAAQAQQSPSKVFRVTTADDDQRLAKSLALKQLLKAQATEAPRGESQVDVTARDGHNSIQYGAPPPTHQSAGYGNSTLPPPAANPVVQSPPLTDNGPDLKTMEANLRKLLKLTP